MGVATLTEGVPNERLDLAQPGVGEYEHQDHGQHMFSISRGVVSVRFVMGPSRKAMIFRQVVRIGS
jgi:hypothetical protein